MLAGVTGASKALGELFLMASGFSVEATERDLGFSLWAPSAKEDSPEGPGQAVQYLPGEAWLLGLGHLGQRSMRRAPFSHAGPKGYFRRSLNRSANTSIFSPSRNTMLFLIA